MGGAPSNSPTARRNKAIVLGCQNRASVLRNDLPSPTRKTVLVPGTKSGCNRPERQMHNTPQKGNATLPSRVSCCTPAVMVEKWFERPEERVRQAVSADHWPVSGTVTCLLHRSALADRLGLSDNETKTSIHPKKFGSAEGQLSAFCSSACTMGRQGPPPSTYKCLSAREVTT